MAPEKQPKWINAQAIADDFGVSLRTAYDWLLLMPHFREGRVIRVSRSAYEAFKRKRIQCQNSFDESDQTEAPATSIGPASADSGSRQVAKTSRRRSSGKSASSSKEPILVAQPRKRLPSVMP